MKSVSVARVKVSLELGDDDDEDDDNSCRSWLFVVFSASAINVAVSDSADRAVLVRPHTELVALGEPCFLNESREDRLLIEDTARCLCLWLLL